MVLLGHLVLAAAQQGVEAVQGVATPDAKVVVMPVVVGVVVVPVVEVVVATRDAKAGGYLVEGGQEEVAQQEVAVVVARKPVSVLALLAAVQRELAVRKPSARVLYSKFCLASYVLSFRLSLLGSQ